MAASATDLVRLVASRRAQQRLSLRDVADRVGVSAQQIHNAENGEATFELTARIAHSLGVPFQTIADSLRRALRAA